jgi:hypothetical protein
MPLCESQELTMSPTISALFQEEPVRWGLRGDPWLWREMRERFADTPTPATVDELVEAVERMFEQLAGHPLSHPEPIFVERFDHGGMSGGMVAPEFWCNVAIPLLKRRFEER